MSTRSIHSISSSSTITDHPDYQNREIGEWLSPLDFLETQRVILHSRAPATGLKPLRSKEYIHWRNGVYKMLFMSGLPGAGKSMAAASVVQDLKGYYEGSPVAVVCVFCDFGQTEMQTANALMASILRQLVHAHPVVHSTVASMYIHHTTQSTFPRPDEIVTSIALSLKQFDRVFVVVDALDECLDDLTRSRLISTLISLPVSLLFTARPHPLIEQVFEGCPRQDIIADQHDLWIYSEERFALSRVGQQCTPVSKQEILSAVVQKAAGLFVVARLLMDALTEASSVKKALDLLRTMPTSIRGTYSKTLQHICEKSDPDIKEVALYSLLWVTFSRRVLAYSELQEIIATMLKPNDPGVIAKQSLVAACAGLITIENKTDKVRLIHHTAHEYLVKEQETLWVNVQRKMAVACVSYLHHILPDLHRPEVYIEEEIRNAVKKHPFFGYALREWGHHVHACEEVKLVNEVLDLLANDTHCTLGRMLTYDAMSSPKCTPWSALHFCAHFNLAPTCLEIIEQHGRHYKKVARSFLSFFRRRRRKDPKRTNFLDIQDDYERTPLMIAAYQGNIDIVRMLSGYGININIKDFHIRTPLSYAMESKSKEAVELLLKQGIMDINLKDIFGRTVLFDAVDTGSADLVSLLFHYHNDVELDAKDNSGRSVLSYAAQYGYCDLVRILLQRGADVNQRDSKGMVPLLYASTEGQAQVTKILCENSKIWINALNVDGRSSLSLAAQLGYEGVVNILLNWPEININLPDMKSRTPLSFSAQYGRTEIVRTLLSREESAIDFEDDLGRTALSYAADQPIKGEEIIRVLLDVGADQNLIDNSGLTPLSYALKQNNRAIVDTLLACPTTSLQCSVGDRNVLSYAAQYGWVDIVKNVMDHPDIDLNGKDNQGMHALAYAAKEGHQEIVELLLSRDDIDITSSDIHCKTSLHHAASFGSEPVARQLISKLSPTYLNQLDDSGRSPLALASLNGHIQVVEMLITLKNLDINSTNRAGLTPLFLAAGSGHIEIVRLLLKQQGILVWLVGNQGQTVLTEVAKQGHANVLNLLLSHCGANEMVDLKDGNFRTPLSYAAQHGRTEVVRRLLECPEVDPHSKDCLNTVFEYAAEMKYRDEVGIMSYTAIMEMISSALRQDSKTKN